MACIPTTVVRQRCETRPTRYVTSDTSLHSSQRKKQLCVVKFRRYGPCVCFWILGFSCRRPSPDVVCGWRICLMAIQWTTLAIGGVTYPNKELGENAPYNEAWHLMRNIPNNRSDTTKHNHVWKVGMFTWPLKSVRSWLQRLVSLNLWISQLVATPILIKTIYLSLPKDDYIENTHRWFDECMCQTMETVLRITRWDR